LQPKAVTLRDEIMSGESRITHGLDGSMVEPDWPAITLAEARQLLALYPCGEPLRILSLSPRPFSSACVVELAAGKKLFIKRHHKSLRQPDGLREEHRFLMHLRAQNLAVPRVIAALDGSTVVSFGGWSCEVHQVPDGTDLYADALSWTPFRTPQHAQALGRFMAKMHLAAEAFSAPKRIAQPLVASFTIFAAADPAQALKQYFASHPALAADPEIMRKAQQAMLLLMPFHAELRPHLAHLPALWTHNDLHPSNLFWSSSAADAEVSAAIDFGLADRTIAIHDIAHAIERSIIAWLDLPAGHESTAQIAVDFSALNAMLEGYNAARPLSVAELASLPAVVALAHFEFALSEAEYFSSVLHSQAKTELAIDGYLLGHARWLCGSAGQRFLSHLRTWCARQSSLDCGNTESQLVPQEVA